MSKYTKYQIALSGELLADNSSAFTKVIKPRHG